MQVTGGRGENVLGFKLKNFDHLCMATDVATYDNRDNQIKCKMVWALKQNKNSNKPQEFENKNTYPALA